MNRRQFNTLFAMSPLAITSEKFTLDRSKKKNKLLKAPQLKKGDKVALVCPAGPIKKDKFVNVLQNLEDLGLVPEYTDHIFDRDGYLAGNDETRLKELNGYLIRSDIKAIWCIRGGYGCTRILSKIDYAALKKYPKIIIGYSDITSLLAAIHAKIGLVCFHGPVLISQPFTQFTKSQIQQLLFEPNSSNHIIPTHPQSDVKYAAGHDAYVITPGRATGRLVGGNLSLLICLPNTGYDISYRGNIVFIEDVGEKPYRIDRMLTYLLEATDLRYAAGIVIGVCNDCEAKEGEESWSLKEVLIDRLQNLKIPCFYGHTFGHVVDIATFPIGIKAEINTSNMTIKLLESCVS